MKRIIYRSLFIVLGLLIPLNVFAATGTVSISCNKTVYNAGDTTKCTVSITADNTPDTVTVELMLSGASIMNATPGDGWDQKGFSGNRFMVYKEGGGTGTVATFDVKLDGDTASIGVKAEIASTITDSQASPTGNTLNLRKADGNANLSSLSVEGKTLNFNKDTLEYSLGETKDQDSIVINAQCESDKANVTGTGKQSLKYGQNSFNVVCKAENGTTKTYVVKINRIDTRSGNANLSSIKLSSGKIDFKSTTYTYKINDFNEDKITIDAATADTKAKITSGTGTFNIKTGENNLKIVVTAENGSTKTYTIVVVKPVSQDELKLKTLTLENTEKNYTYGFKISDNTNTYKKDVDLDIDKIEIKAELLKGNGKIDGLGVKELKEGENTFTLKIIAGDQTREITLIINRVDPNSMTMEDFVSKITIEGNNTKFSINKSKYTIDVENSVTKIVFSYPENENFKFESSGTDNLAVGENTVKFKVIGKDNESKTFEVLVNRLEEETKLDELKLCLIILCILEFLVIVILTIVILTRRKKLANAENA